MPKCLSCVQLGIPGEAVRGVIVRFTNNGSAFAGLIVNGKLLGSTVAAAKKQFEHKKNDFSSRALEL